MVVVELFLLIKKKVVFELFLVLVKCNCVMFATFMLNQLLCSYNVIYAENLGNGFL